MSSGDSHWEGLRSWLGGGARTAIAEADWKALELRFRGLPLGAGEARERLRERTAEFLGSKHIDGAGGVEPEPETRLGVALLGALPVRELGIDWYAGWRTVVLYPAGFRAPRRIEDEHGVVHEYDEELAGEAWPDGPVILSLDDLRADLEDHFADGSVALHEFAHQLDLTSGAANGRPPLHPEMAPAAWTEAFSRAYADLERRAARGQALALPEDALDDPAEFFAVASEMFFTAPAALRASYPEVYTQLSAFYRQDPRRVPGRGCTRSR